MKEKEDLPNAYSQHNSFIITIVSLEHYASSLNSDNKRKVVKFSEFIKNILKHVKILPGRKNKILLLCEKYLVNLSMLS